MLYSIFLYIIALKDLIFSDTTLRRRDLQVVNFFANRYEEFDIIHVIPSQQHGHSQVVHLSEGVILSNQVKYS